VHHGRHFGRTIHALCNVQTLLTNGILRIGDLADRPDDSFTAEYGVHFLPSCPIYESMIPVLYLGKEENIACFSYYSTAFRDFNSAS
jgi:hypothetical protein